jgi:hypothetical protein
MFSRTSHFISCAEKRGIDYRGLTTLTTRHAQGFIDVNYLDGLITSVAKKQYGDDVGSSKWTLDCAPLKRYLETQLNQIYKNQESLVSLDTLYGYGTFNSKRLVMRCLIEEGIPIRSFRPLADPTISAIAPAIALTADLVHACSIRGPIDEGSPLYHPPPVLAGTASKEALQKASSELSLSPMTATHIVLALIGNIAYTPALIRALQHDRDVVVASASSDWNVLSSMHSSQANCIAPILLDSLLEQIIVPVDKFKLSALTLGDIADSVHAIIVKTAGLSSLLTGKLLAQEISKEGLLKELRRHNVLLSQVIKKYPSLFTYAESKDSKTSWTCSALPKPVPIIAPVPAPQSASTAKSHSKNKVSAAAVAAVESTPLSNGNTSGARGNASTPKPTSSKQGDGSKSTTGAQVSGKKASKSASAQTGVVSSAPSPASSSAAAEPASPETPAVNERGITGRLLSMLKTRSTSQAAVSAAVVEAKEPEVADLEVAPVSVVATAPSDEPAAPKKAPKQTKSKKVSASVSISSAPADVPSPPEAVEPVAVVSSTTSVNDTHPTLVALLTSAVTSNVIPSSKVLVKVDSMRVLLQKAGVPGITTKLLKEELKQRLLKEEEKVSLFLKSL